MSYLMRNGARAVLQCATLFAFASCGAGASTSPPQGDGSGASVIIAHDPDGGVMTGHRCDDMPTVACSDRTLIRCDIKTNTWHCDEGGRPTSGLSCFTHGFFPCPADHQVGCDHTVNRWACEDLSKTDGQALPHFGIPCDHEPIALVCGLTRTAKCDTNSNTWKCVAR